VYTPHRVYRHYTVTILHYRKLKNTLYTIGSAESYQYCIFKNQSSLTDSMHIIIRYEGKKELLFLLFNVLLYYYQHMRGRGKRPIILHFGADIHMFLCCNTRTSHIASCTVLRVSLLQHVHN